MQGCPGISILSWCLLTSIVITFPAGRRQKKKKKKKRWRQMICTVHTKRLFGDYFFRCVRLEFSWNRIKCKNNDPIKHICFSALTFAGSPGKKFEHSALRPRVQTISSGPWKCKCMNMYDPYIGWKYEKLDILEFHRIPRNTQATSWENLFMPYVNNKGADQHAHPRNLISAFVVRWLGSIIPILAKSKISRLASCCSWAGRYESYLVANAKDRFSHDVAHLHSDLFHVTL